MTRYIDEDRLYSNIEEKYKVAQGDAREAYNDVLDTICEIPTADVQEVRHGHWIPEKDIEYFGIWDTFICSKCCHRTLTECNYCSCCGAKMDEEEQE